MIAAIGGYFELELPPQKNILYPEAKRYQSARAAFLALIRAVKPKRVWMPFYICDSIIAPVHAEGIEIYYYSLNEDFSIRQPVFLHSQDILFYVNYFGVCDRQVQDTLEKFNPLQTVIDCSQAIYAKPYNCLATIYSPRKFFGIPDGGLLATEHSVLPPQQQDRDSEKRMEHLIKRLGETPEAGYAAFQQAEKSLSDMEPRSMSTLTEKLLRSVDFGESNNIRNKNFQYLHKYLYSSNILSLSNFLDGPMCYPYMTQKNIRKNIFTENKIFIATYWPEVLGRVNNNSFEAKLVTQCFPLPCDQRYEESSLGQILNLL